MCFHPSDSVVSALLEDDRVALRLSSLESVVVEELYWLANRPNYAWVHLTRCQGDPTCFDLKFSTLSAAHGGAGFADERTFSVARQYTWKFAIGDIRANLEEKKQQTDAPPDSTTSKIWSLQQFAAVGVQPKPGLFCRGTVQGHPLELNFG